MSEELIPLDLTLSEAAAARHEEVDRILCQLLQGCSEEDFTRLSCPFCGSAIRLYVHPRLRTFSLTCSVKKGSHFMRTESVQNPPRWWQSKVTYGWTD